jgi:hypothetical protein
MLPDPDANHLVPGLAQELKEWKDASGSIRLVSDDGGDFGCLWDRAAARDVYARSLTPHAYPDLPSDARVQAFLESHTIAVPPSSVVQAVGLEKVSTVTVATGSSVGPDSDLTSSLVGVMDAVNREWLEQSGPIGDGGSGDPGLLRSFPAFGSRGKGPVPVTGIALTVTDDEGLDIGGDSSGLLQSVLNPVGTLVEKTVDIMPDFSVETLSQPFRWLFNGGRASS